MWVRCKARYNVSELTDDQIEDLGIEPEYDYEDFCFNIRELSNFNRCDNGTTIELKNGLSQLTDMDFDQLCQIVISQQNKYFI